MSKLIAGRQRLISQGKENLSKNLSIEKWRDIHSQLISIKNDETNSLAGFVFEHFAKAYFMFMGYKKVYLLSEVPRSIREKLNIDKDDFGVDLVLQDNHDRFLGVQVKFRKNEKTTLTWSKDKLSNLIGHNGFSGHVVFSNASQVCDTTKKQGKRLQSILISDMLSLSKYDIQSILEIMKSPSSTKTRKGATARDYQDTAIKDIIKGFKTADRGQLVFPCRAGKTPTSQLLTEKMNNKLTLVVVPTLTLLRQFKNDWISMRNIDFDYFCVCSAKDIDKANGESSDIMADLGLTGLGITTKPKEILKMLQEGLSSPNDRLVVFSTYQSLERVSEAIKGTDIEFDLTICDEAHKTASTKNTTFSTVHDQKKIPSKKRLYMTATPKVLSSKLRDDGMEDLVNDMNNPKVFGGEFHRMNFPEAIEKGIISDYDIVITIVNDKEISEFIKTRKFLKDGNAEFVASCIAADKMFGLDCRNVISFHNSIKSANLFKELNKKIAPDRNTYTVSSKMSTASRALAIDDFSSDTNALMTNARCLTEGITVRSVDGIIFADPKNSVIDIVQAASRCLNKKPEGKKAIICIPLHISGDDVEEEIKSNSFKNVVKIIRAMSIYDHKLKQEITGIKEGDAERSLSDMGSRIKIGSTKIDVISSIMAKDITNNIELQLLKKAMVKSKSAAEWTREKVELVLRNEKFKNIAAWQRCSSSSYNWAIKQSWYKDICNKYALNSSELEWSKGKVEEVLDTNRIKTLKSWVRISNKSNAWARKQPWYEEVVEKYGLRVKRERWTRGTVEGKLKNQRFKNLYDWQKKCGSSQTWARKQDWYEEVAQKYGLNVFELGRTQKKVKENIQTKKYQTIKEWREDNLKEQAWASKQDWYKDTVQEFDLYSKNLNRTKQSVEERLTTNNFKNIQEWDVKGSGDCQWARKQPWFDETVRKFKLRVSITNRTRASVEKSIICNKYKTLQDWRNCDPREQCWAGRQDWYQEVLVKFGLYVKNNNRNKEDIVKILEINKFRNIKQWDDFDRKSYQWSLKQDWYEEVVSRFNLRTQGFAWTKTKVCESIEINGFTSLKEWRDGDYSTYNWASKQNWYEEVLERYSLRKKGFKWTRKKIVEDILKPGNFNSIKEWEGVSRSSVAWARKQPWYGEIKSLYFNKEPQNKVARVAFAKRKKAA
jgi:superfamily II DNA or RNA helicase